MVVQKIMETITLTKNTLVDRKLVSDILGISLTFVVGIVLLICLVLYFDFQANWEAQRCLYASFKDDPVEQRQRYKELREYQSFHDQSPAGYSGLRKNYLYVLIGIPLFASIPGALLLRYQAVTVKTLLRYHIFLTSLLFTFIFYVMLTLTIAHGVLSYSMVPPIDKHAHCYQDDD